MSRSPSLHLLGGALLLLATLALVPSAPAGAEDTTLFRRGGWVVVGTTDTGPNPMPIRILVGGKPKGRFSEIKVFHDVPDLGTPQVFSVKGNGAMRPVLPPPGEFGGTFYGTGYWDCQSGFQQGMRIRKLGIGLDPASPTSLRLKGTASSPSNFKATDFKLRFPTPSADLVQVRVTYTPVATRDLCVDQTRQAHHEGFRVARIASNYLSDEVHDSDQARYVDSEGTTVCASLRNHTALVFDHPLPMARSRLFLVHTDSAPRVTPTLSLVLRRPRPPALTPQGFVTMSSDPNDDNVDLWANWDRAKSSYPAGQAIGAFSYTMRARTPGPLPCG